MNDTDKGFGFLPRVGFDLTITLGMVLVIMDSILAEVGPGHVAGGGGISCRYVDPTETYSLKASCIVGKVFERLGVLRALTGPTTSPVHFGDQIQQGLANGPGLTGGSLRNDLETVHGIFMTDDAFFFLTECQMSQDAGDPWGVAIENASRLLNERRGEPTSQFGLLKIHEEVNN